MLHAVDALVTTVEAAKAVRGIEFEDLSIDP
jgi:hypothetical protein